MDNLIGVSIGNYEIVEKLGRGGMANVYKAFHAGLAVHRALKVIRPDLIAEQGFNDRFQLEARAIAALRHPNIVQIHDFGEQDGLFYMVMELVEGENLRDRIQRLGPIRPFAEALRIVEQVASALGYAHGKNILHRDVKPENILLSSSGDAILADFGIAKMLDSGDAKLTATGIGIGTPAYMAPEIARGKTDLGPAIDLYACGVVLYEALTARTPFAAQTPLAVLQQVINDPVPPPRDFTADIPDALQGVVLKAMDKDPALRYPDADAFIEACRQSLLGLGPQATAGMAPASAGVATPGPPPPPPGIATPGAATPDAATPDAATTDENAPTRAFDSADASLPPTVVASGAPPSIQAGVPPAPPVPVVSPSTPGPALPSAAGGTGRSRRWLLAAVVALLFLVAFSTAAFVGVRRFFGGGDASGDSGSAASTAIHRAIGSEVAANGEADGNLRDAGSIAPSDRTSDTYGEAGYAAGLPTERPSGDPAAVAGSIDVSSIRETLESQDSPAEREGSDAASRDDRSTPSDAEADAGAITTRPSATIAAASAPVGIEDNGAAALSPTARSGHGTSGSGTSGPVGAPSGAGRPEPPPAAPRFDAMLDLDRVLAGEIAYEDRARLGIEFHRPMRVLFDIVIANNRGRYILTGPDGETIFEQLGNDYGPFRIEEPGFYELTVEMEDESEVPLYYEVQFRRAEW